VEHSDTAVKMLNGRLVGGKIISAFLWDGKEKFKKEESSTERKLRDESWEKYLEEGDEAEGN